MPNEKKPKTKCVEYLRHAEYYDMQSTFDELYAEVKPEKSLTA